MTTGDVVSWATLIVNTISAYVAYKAHRKDKGGKHRKPKR